MNRARFVVPLALCAFGSCCALGDIVTVTPAKDNTIFSEGDLSNALSGIFAGKTLAGASRRGLIQFDVASVIPAGATVEDVVLTMNVSKLKFGGGAALHRLTSDWGEGTSNGFDSGPGAPATDGDATWRHTFYNSIPEQAKFWNTPGGDFLSATSSSLFVPAFTFDTIFQFPSTPVMVQDVQHWLDVGGNFGWMIQGDEAGSDAIRFDSREASFSGNVPSLRIQYSMAAPPQWNLDADGSWANPGNWSSNSVPDSPTAIANFLGKITAPRTITLDGDRTVGTINFDSFNRYTIAPGTGGTLTMGGPGAHGAINLNPATHEISAKVIVAAPSTFNVPGDGRLILSGGLAINNGAPLLMSGDGDLTLSGPQTHQNGATLTINNLRLANNSNSGAPASATTAASAPLAVTISGGPDVFMSTMTLGASQDLNSLTINFADEGTQYVDLNGDGAEIHVLRIHGGDLNAAKSALAASIANGKTNGEGIVDFGLHPGGAIGVAKLTDAHGEAYVLVRPTRVGDLNLDGSVTISDFIDLASHFNAAGDWQTGDLNGDGVVTISDFIDLASNFNSSYSGEVFPISGADRSALEAFAAAHGVSLVPEPGAMMPLLAGAAFLHRRRRYSHRH